MHDIVNVISNGLGLTLQCFTLITVLYGFYKFTRKPTESLEGRVAALEDWKEHTANAQLRDADIHLKANDEATRVTQSALVAIMDTLASMDGVPDSQKQEIQSKRSDLWNYLTNK